MGLFIRLLLILGGAAAGLFVAQDSHHYQILQMVFGVLAFTIFAAILAFWPTIKRWFDRAD